MKKHIRLLLLLSIIIFIPLISSCSHECAHENMHVSTVSPTCDAEGYTLHSCPDCGTEYKTDILAPKGHTLTDTVFAPTCTLQGYTEHSCECGYNFKDSYLEPLGHTYVTKTVAAACEREGYTSHTCSVCEHVYLSEITSALEHDFTPTVYAPDCENAGYTEHKCKNCEITYVSDQKPPLGHELSTTHCSLPTKMDSGILTQKCGVCEHSYTSFLSYSDVYTDAYITNTNVLSQGVDVSLWQHQSTSGDYLPLDWSAIKAAGVDFAILKAGSTLSGIDPVFEMNYEDAKAAGLELGAYFYIYTTVDKDALNSDEEQVRAEALALAEEQARTDVANLLTWLDGKQFEYPIYLDVEDSSLTSLGKNTLTELCMLFIDTLRDNGYYGALYCGEYFMNTHLHAETMKNYCELWYTRPLTGEDGDDVFLDDIYIYDIEKYCGQYGVWQYSWCGVIDGVGISDRICLDYSYKDYASMMKKFGLNGFTIQQQA